MSTYNGYANYETWNVVLWVMNDEGLYEGMRTCNDDWTPDRAREFVEDYLPNGTPDFDDMGKAQAYDRVDWSEVAAAFAEG